MSELRDIEPKADVYEFRAENRYVVVVNPSEMSLRQITVLLERLKKNGLNAVVVFSREKLQILDLGENSANGAEAAPETPSAEGCGPGLNV